MTTQTCIILAGGLGTRLRAIVGDVPKCLAPVRGKPFLHWQIDSLRRRGVERFVLSLGHGASQVEDAVAAFDTSVRIDCVTEPRALGTGGAIAFALDACGLREAMVANGDTSLGGDLQPMLGPIRADAGEQLRVATTLVTDRARFGGLEADSDGRVVHFLEKGTQGPGPINAGLYRVHRAALPSGNDAPYSLESECFPALTARGALFAAPVSGPFIDIGVPEDYRRYCDDHERFR
ncbi:nucleotidyl transferase [Rubrivivax gelatinosus]|nr:nucleotidyl transferase [Rubrivivax gelatinosus]